MAELLSRTGPWSPWIAVARSVLALSMAGSLAVTPPAVLFARLSGTGGADQCGGTAAWSLFCSLPPGESPWAVVLAVAVLVWVASGVLPAVSAIPFAFVAYSVTTAGTLVDGGDQVVLVAAVLFIPYSLCDWRLFAWRPPGEEAGVIRATVARAAILTLKVQISIVYLVACIGKLATEAWTEGSALYYWTRIPAFGTPNWLEGLVYATTGNPAISVILTWGTLVLEFALGVSLLLPLRFRLNVLLPARFFLHGAILFVMGIASFSIAMFGAVLLLLVPADSSWSLLAHRWYSSAPVRRESKEEVPHVVP
ncbi:sporulation-delaying protein SdpB family protein [Microbacterium foliorum]|uniref:sporulation-delaying protein SdpB family protein n=1 Tax=Microbacterium foliorum TaxID=104336 RepID=UPI0028D2956C|nr:sporulation-delaying protein SdpB family protein [Microbacterium foliorum]